MSEEKIILDFMFPLLKEIHTEKFIKSNMAIFWEHKSVLKLIEEERRLNPIEIIRDRARHLVLNALESGWSGPPYNPIELARILNFEIEPKDSLAFDARIVPSGRKSYKIEYNPFQKQTRVNFTIAHEIAHTLFSDCSEEIRHRNIDEVEHSELEFLCNIAASEILLPYGTFTEDVNSINEIDIHNLIKLSNKYQASLEAVFLRFAEVIDKPCTIIVGSLTDGKIHIDYYKKSPSATLNIPDDYVIPVTSKAYECSMPGWTASGEEKWDIFSEKSMVYAVGLNFLKHKKNQRIGILIVPKYNTVSINKVYLEYGDATKPRGNGRKIIAQVVNTSAALGLGFGKSLVKNYPIVANELKTWSYDKSKFQLGKSQLIKINDNLFVFQMLAQKGIRATANEIPLKYSSLKQCLEELADTALELNASIHMPQIGAGQAKGDWKVILAMIHEELINRGIRVNVYMLPGKAYNPKLKSNLTLFDEQSTYDE